MMRRWLSPAQLALRDEAFRRAERWIVRARDQGGVTEPVTRSFRNPGLPSNRSDARVDVEVRKGAAFGRDIIMR